MTDSQDPGAGDRQLSLPEHPPLPRPWEVPPPLLYLRSLPLPPRSALPHPPPPHICPPPLPLQANRGVHTSSTPYGLPPAYPVANQAYLGQFFAPNGQISQGSAQPTFPTASGAGPGLGFDPQFFNPIYNLYSLPPLPVPQVSTQPFPGAPVTGQAFPPNPFAHSSFQQQASQSAVPRRRKVNGHWQMNPLHAVRSDANSSSRVVKPQKPQTPSAMADAILKMENLTLGQKVNDAAKPKATKKTRKEIPAIVPPAPEPTQDYLRVAAMEPTVADTPQKMLVILDLNGTLLHRPTRGRPTHFIPRPSLEPFLRYLFDNFCVMVWSSAKPANVNGMIEQAFTDKQQKDLIAVWARNTFGLSGYQYAQKVQVYKDLKKVWLNKSIQLNIWSLSDKNLFTQRNTILIDDSFLKASAQPFNLLEVPEFAGTKKQMKSDFLREVVGYLNVVKKQSNVSSFMRTQPFKANGTWNYDWPDEEDGQEAGQQPAQQPGQHAGQQAELEALERQLERQLVLSDNDDDGDDIRMEA
ncbi:hypothetical protein K491DRAFT_410839 [Lophiostoma macrostomum CBS 122681]|uniref:Mitochondrial import inner membrane translocase subunit TIM50 n=1 Tax=Lophiostoma macrostomum CBS 122681 TaxID=1314788 RepID=A0A6A6T9Z4_9PLEO|nr:hypothetical protein K491DRAFT_410839 [Lophiostoma macrostomum CBS 122681]